jgi:hypothetical protein
MIRRDFLRIGTGGVIVALAARSPQSLASEVVEYRLTSAPLMVSPSLGVSFAGLAYNGTIPGPLLRVTYGQRVRIRYASRAHLPSAVRRRLLAWITSPTRRPPELEQNLSQRQSDRYDAISRWVEARGAAADGRSTARTGRILRRFGCVPETMSSFTLRIRPTWSTPCICTGTSFNSSRLVAHGLRGPSRKTSPSCPPTGVRLPGDSPRIHPPDDGYCIATTTFT